VSCWIGEDVTPGPAVRYSATPDYGEEGFDVTDLGDVFTFGHKEYDWVQELTTPQLQKAAAYLIAVREGCCDYLWRMQHNPEQPAAVGQMELRMFSWAMGALHGVFGWDEFPFDTFPDQEVALTKPSPRWLLSLCDSVLSIMERRAEA